MRRSIAAILFAGAIGFVLLTSRPAGWGCARPALPPFEVHGHRGAAGQVPPGNLLPSFLRAIDDGATTLEGDLRITKDDELILNHDPQLSRKCQTEAAGLSRAIDELTLEQVLRHDCDPSIPGVQAPLTLRDLLDLHERGTFGFNLEIKPEGVRAAKLVLTALERYTSSCGECLTGKVLVQSFHRKHLEYLRGKIAEHDDGEPRYRLSYLTALPSPEEIPDLSRLADVYSPRFGEGFDSRLIEAAHRHGMRVIPWTVNEPQEICEAARLGADGVITDYPGRANEMAALVATLGRRPKNCVAP